MAERITALGEIAWPTLAEPRLVLSERPVAGAWLIQVGADAKSAPLEALGWLCGFNPLPMPLSGGVARDSATALLAVIAPGRCLLVTSDANEAAALAERIDPDAAIACRCQRAWLRLDGSGVDAFLDRRLGIDLRGGALAAGQMAVTRLGPVDVLVHAAGEGGFDLLPARSFAAALAETLCDAAAAEGVRLAVQPAADHQWSHMA